LTLCFPDSSILHHHTRRQKLEDSEAKILDIIFGRWRSQILYTGVRLGVFDTLSEGEKSVTDIAKVLNLDPPLCYRLLRALGSLELLKESRDRTFSLTTAGEFLQRDHPQTLRGVTLLENGPEHYALWKHLPTIIQDGNQNAFPREFGHMAFDHATQNPGYGEVFNEGMTSYSLTETEWVLQALKTYDFSKVSTLCDIGGGHGHTLCNFLKAYPHLKGIVLELASVIEDKDLLWADKMNVGNRCAYIAGDMFKEVPQADAYILKHMLHDWDDRECVQILSNIHNSAPSDGAIFIIEYVVPDPETPHFSKLFDIHMMCWGTGRERTIEEYIALLAAAGWKYLQTWYPPAKIVGSAPHLLRPVVEAAKA
jgi:predicted transcriptional regulator